MKYGYAATLRSICLCGLMVPSLCWGQADKPKAPNLPASLASYVSVTATLTKAAEDATAELRTFKRMQLIRGAIGGVIYNGNSDSRLKLSYTDMLKLMCDSREEYFKARSPAQTLTAINASLTQLYTDTNVDDPTWKKFIRWLATTIKNKKAELPKLHSRKIYDVCVDDISTFEVIAYGPPTQPELKAIGDIIGGLKDVIAVVEPVVKQVLQIAQDAARRDAVRRFFRDENNQKSVSAAAKDLRESVQLTNERGRAIAFAGAAEAWAKLSLSDLELKTLKPCEAFLKLARADRVGTSPLQYAPQFIHCHNAVMASLKDDIAAVLTKAAAYDAVADVGAASKSMGDDADKKFLQMLQSLANPKAGFDEFFSWIGTYVDLAIAIENASSKENQEKVKKAIDKALGRT
jgi:hypothetical protein